MSILDKNISYYPSIKATNNGIEVNLLKILQSHKHEGAITNLRNEANCEMQKKLKELLPCYTVAGVFNSRSEKACISMSGLAAIDLDSAEEYDAIELLNELKKLPYIAYAGLSCRGQRLFCIVPFQYPEKYNGHYERLIKSFEDIGLPMGDTCHKQISQPRFVSFNTNQTCFYNHTAKYYHLLSNKKIYHIDIKARPKKNNKDNNVQKVEKCIAKIHEKNIDIAPLYNDWVKIGFALVHEFRENGRDYFHCVSQFHPEYDYDETDKLFSNLLKANSSERQISIGTFFFYCKQAGIAKT